MGRTVEAGDILVTLDAEPQRLERSEQAARLAGMEAELAALRSQIAAEEKARGDERQAARVATEQAVAQQREAAAPAQYSKDEMRRLGELKRLGLIAEREYERGKAEAERNSATVDTSKIAVRRIEQDQRTRDSERDARVQRLEADIARIEGQRQALAASMERLQYEVERRVIRAPISGKLGEVKILRPGAVVAEGDRLAAIVPDGKLRIVANFPPPAAIGRLRQGQTARMRMHGFPWAQYGLVHASVTRVADEIRDNAVRVELTVTNTAALRVPLQHGMPGSLEVEVDHVSPAALALRLAGQWIAQPREAHAQTEQQAAVEQARR